MKKVIGILVVALFLFTLVSCSYDCKTCEDKKRLECTVCDGEGEYTCYECNGSGEKKCTRCTIGKVWSGSPYSPSEMQYRDCPYCDGGMISCSKTKDCLSCSAGKVDCPDCD